MDNFIKPNWEKSNLNISATLAEFLGVPNQNATLPILKHELEKGYKNIVFICFDGLGINPIMKNLDENTLLRRNIKEVLTSTFPSTTTNATTSLITNKLPLEHGWFGWTLYFDEIKKSLDLYVHVDSDTYEKVEFEYPIDDNADCYFDHANSDYEINAILPAYVQTKHPFQKIEISSLYELTDEIRNVCLKSGKQFIYAYFPEPDATMHDYGVTSVEANYLINEINEEIERLHEELSDTLFVITADHGQIDIDGVVEFYKDKEMNELLETKPFLDARTPAFIVKKGKEEQFEKLFEEKYGEDFKLFKSSWLIENNYFGDRGEYGYLLGDYIAVGTETNKQFLARENSPIFKGHHTSLTAEMEVPLIILK